MPQNPHLTRLATLGALTALLAWAPSAAAQTAQSSATAPTETQENPQHHNATTTASGTTGIWFVPTAEVLPNRAWSASLYRTNIDDGQGFSDVSTFPITFAWGLGGRAELFGSWQAVTRIDRDTRPLFFTNSAGGAKAGTGGGLLVDYPLMHSQWTGNKRGDLWVGGKVNLLAGSSAPVAVAVRAMAKVPVGDDGAGVSSGKPDFEVDGIVSGFNPVAEVSGYGGVLVRGNPADYTLTNGFRWGVGAAFPQKYSLGIRVSAELFGERYFNDVIHAPAGLIGSDGSFVPTDTSLKNPIVGLIGLTWQAPGGFFIGAAASWNLTMKGRSDAGISCTGGVICPPGETVSMPFTNTPKDGAGLQIRIGFHPGSRGRRTVEVPAPPPPPPPPPPPAPVAPANRPPTVRAACDPCTVEIGQTSTVSADAQDPDGDPLTYQWSTPAGTLASPTARQSLWTAPGQPGPVPVSVTVDDGKGGTASDQVTIQVIYPREYTFEDVHFEFDRYTLRPDALRLLNDAVSAMQANPNLRIQIEGHTCNIGTSEYNLALGERRAQAVRDYLVSRGIAAGRLTTVSFGEEQPKYDNSRESTRRLNRRAALVVRMQ